MKEFEQDTDLNKAKAMPVGTVKNGRRKMSDGSWRALSKEEKDIVNQISETKSKIQDIDDKKKKVQDLQAKKDAATKRRKEAEARIEASKKRIAELKSRLNKSGGLKLKDTDGKTTSTYDTNANEKRKQRNMSEKHYDSSTNTNTKPWTTSGSAQSDHQHKLEAKKQKENTKQSTRIWTKEKGWHTPSGRGPDKKKRKSKLAKADLIDLLECLNKAKRDEIGTVRNGRRKVAEGKWVAEKQSADGKGNLEQVKDEKPSKKTLSAQQHKAEAERNFDVAMEYSNYVNKMQDKINERRKIDKTFQPPAKAQRLLDMVKEKAKFHTKLYKEHKSQSVQNYKTNKPKANKYLTHKVEKAKPFVGYNPEKNAKTGGLNSKAREKYNRETGGNLKAPVTSKNPKGKEKSRKNSFCARFGGMKGPDYKMVDGKKTPTAKKKAKDRWKCSKSEMIEKSLIAVDEQGSAVETANYNIDAEATESQVDLFYNTMQGYNYGDAPRTIELDSGYSIILSKVDDGLYSGFVRQTVDWDGDSPLEETVGKVEKQTIPAIISYLKAKEFISPIQNKLAEAIDAVPFEVETNVEADEIQEIAEIVKEEVESVEVPTTQDRVLAIKLIDLLDRLV